MARGTFRKISVALGTKLSDIRRAFGKTAARVAKDILASTVRKLVGDRARSDAILSRPGPLWLTTVRHVYKIVGELMREKLAGGALRIDEQGMNITADEVTKRLSPAYEDDIRRVLREELKVAV